MLTNPSISKSPGPCPGYRSALLVLLAAMLILGNAQITRAKVVDRIVAVVNDEIILLSELNQALKPYLARIHSQSYDEADERRLLFQVREDILNKMIDERLTDQEVKRNRIMVSEAEIDQMIERIKETNYYTDEELRQALNMEGLTLESYREQLKGQVLRARLVNLQVKSKIVITDKDVRTYYEEHKDKYQGSKLVGLRNIVMKKTTTYDEEAEQAIHKRMSKVKEALDAGGDFAALARQYSESPQAAEGGYLGEFDLEPMAVNIREAIQDLKPGQFTPIIDTDLGYQIFYVEDIKQSAGKSLEEVSTEIEDKLYNEIVDRNFAKWLEDLRNRSHIKIVK